MRYYYLKISLLVFSILLLSSCSKKGGKEFRDAAEAGNIDLVKQLLEKGVDVNWKDQYTGTALHRAAFKGNVPMVEFLLSKGANVNEAIEPGLLTVWSKTRDEDRGKLSEIENAYGVTPLHIAINNNHFEIVKILLNSGASIRYALTLGYDSSKPKNLRTTLDIAISQGNKDIIDYLRQYENKSSDNESDNNPDESPQKEMLEKKAEKENNYRKGELTSYTFEVPLNWEIGGRAKEQQMRGMGFSYGSCDGSSDIFRNLLKM